AFL
ncbi:hypothetical protein D046_8525, partial [Vibrio parahaemolyticus V-223/04]